MGSSGAVTSSGNVCARERALAPRRVDAVFDHVGGEGIVDSWRLLAPGGTFVSYGTAATRDDQGSGSLPELKLLGRMWLWSARPNGRRRAYFFNMWAGRAYAKNRFRARLRSDLTQVFTALQRGEITAKVAAEILLARAAEAMRLTESNGRRQGGPGP